MKLPFFQNCDLSDPENLFPGTDSARCFLKMQDNVSPLLHKGVNKFAINFRMSSQLLHAWKPNHLTFPTLFLLYFLPFILW